MSIGIERLLRTMVCCLFLGLSAAAHAQQALSFAVVPQFAAQRILDDWTPVLKELSKRTGIALTLKHYQSIPEFEADFLKGGPDVAYMNPYHLVMASKAAGYTPIIRDDASRLKGILVVRRDSKITQLEQLDGATLAFPAPNAFGASLYMRALLTNEAKIRFTPVYVNTHPNVFRQVALGRVQAGGAVMRTLEDESPQLRAQLRVVYETPPAYSHPIAVHSRVDAGARQALQQAFLAMGKEPAFAKLLNEILIPLPVVATLADYTPLDKLQLERFVVTQQQ